MNILEMAIFVATNTRLKNNSIKTKRNVTLFPGIRMIEV